MPYTLVREWIDSIFVKENLATCVKILLMLRRLPNNCYSRILFQRHNWNQNGRQFMFKRPKSWRKEKGWAVSFHVVICKTLKLHRWSMRNEADKSWTSESSFQLISNVEEVETGAEHLRCALNPGNTLDCKFDNWRAMQ